MPAERILYTDDDVDQIVSSKDDRIAELEAHVRRSIACIESMQPYVMWDGVDGEDEQTKVKTTLAMLRGAVKG